MKIDKATVKAELDADTRDVSVLWNQAVQDYNATTGIPLAHPHFKDTKEMIKFGSEGAEQFQSWRHGDKRVDKLRSLFMQNIDFIEAGAKQLIAAATPAFPPAAAIGTAMTFVLSGCKGQSADYDAVVNFFEDMNNFLQRVTIIEKRVPRKKAYQNALMDVFSSLLRMCAVAHKFIKLGRFKKWAINSILGGDAELAGGRQTMDKSLSRLQSATEFAILDNSENMLEKQDVLGSSLTNFQQELRRNQNVQERLAQGQALALEGISTSIEDLSSDLRDIKQLLRSRNQEQSLGQSANDVQHDLKLGNPVKILLASALTGVDPMSLLSDLKKTKIAGTGSWLFNDPTWLAWKDDNTAQLIIQGNRGVGKSHLSLAIYEHLHLLTQGDDGNQVCTVYFQFRLNDDSSNYLMAALAAVAVQIMDQNSILRQRLTAQLQRDEEIVEFADNIEDSTKTWQFFVLRFFEAASDFQLYMVFDNVDSLRDETEINSFNDLMHAIEEEKLRIKVVTTRASVKSFRAAPIVEVGRPQFRHDLRELVRDRIHSSDTMYAGIRSLTKHTKQKMARKIEHHADGLLYAEQILRFLGSIHRETAVNSILDAQMPVDVADVYGMMLARAQSRLGTENLPRLKSIVIWAVFALRSLNLKEIGQLSAMIGLQEGVAEEVLSERLRSFFETSHIDLTELQTPVDSSALFEEAFVDTTAAHFGDNDLHLKLRHESMKSFFSGGGRDSALRTTLALAHYHIFMATSGILCRETQTKSSTLENYAALFCLQHWGQIDLSELSETEQSNACHELVRLIKCSHFGRHLCQLPAETSMFDILGNEGEFQEAWPAWSELAKSLELDAETSSYWCNRFDCALWPLAKSLLGIWLNAPDSSSALRAYTLARATTELTQYRQFLHLPADSAQESLDNMEKDPPEKTTILKEMRELVAAAKLAIGPDSRFAMAVVLSSGNDHQDAVRELRGSLETRSTIEEQARDQIQLVLSLWKMEDWDQTIWYCDALLGLFSRDSPGDDANNKSTDNEIARQVAGSILPEYVERDTESKAITPENRSWTLAIKADALHALGRYSEAACCYREARLSSPKIVPPGNLLYELLNLCCVNYDYNALIDIVMHDFKPIERLNLLTDPSLKTDPNLEPSRLILRAGTKTGRHDDIVKLYREVIKTLDAQDASTPLRLELAQIQWALLHDIPSAKALLNQVFDSTHDSMRYQLTNASLSEVVPVSAQLMADILLNEFRNSSTAEDKVQIMLELKDLPNRSLSHCGILVASVWHGCRLALALMLQKIGPASELQALLNQLFEDCLVNLRDSTEANDDENIFILAKVLAIMPALQKHAQLVFSNVKQDLSPREREKTELERHLHDDDLIPCDGQCHPITNFKPWKQAIYLCLICTNITLCEDCHETRMKWNSTSKPDDEPNFCCDNGRYLKGPIEGWKGMQSGVMSLSPISNQISPGIRYTESDDGTIEIKFPELLEDIEVAWQKAWEDHWRGF